ncbi:MAG: S8 family serine peptidase [Trichodesmium sp. MAG_R04]|nr:S8 family serine peptidase [Trichodesmium sp. MAG_R04]
MVEQKNQNLPSIIYAEVSVRSQSGESLLKTSEIITSKNVERFYSEPQLVNATAEKLRIEGFNVLSEGPISITIAAPPEVYERVFQTNIITQEIPIIKGGVYPTKATFLSVPNAEISGLIDSSASSLTNFVEGVAINEPVYYTNSVIPPKPNYWHLNVPDDICQGINAHSLHDAGIEGTGIKVVMVDSGWYRHPFFESYGYQGKVVLDGGAVNPELDENGHGTGESANLFAIAPNVELTMVKAKSKKSALVNSVGAFKKAVSLNPDIISCSWGEDQKDLPLSAFAKVMSAIVSDAVNRGIIVIFSAGNGRWSFPGQHPDVISAGGVYLSSDGKLEASDYASGFRSRIFPQRTVPDVCGLVGKLPRATYIMLPVQPGSLMDVTRGARNIGYPYGDETLPKDGWAVFSGTSAAAPQLAGICALMKQVYPQISPQQARDFLKKTARDIFTGKSSLSTGGNQANIGVDLATGSGLADAFQAIMMTAKAIGKTILNSTQLAQQQPEKFLVTNQIQTKEIIMDSILRSKIGDIIWEFDKVLQEMMADNPQMPKVELSISDLKFVSRSPSTIAAATLRKTLEDTTKDIKLRLSASEGLLKIGYYQEAVLKFLTDPKQALKVIDESIKDEKEKSDLHDRVFKALGEISSDSIDTYSSGLDSGCICSKGGQCVSCYP